MLRLALVHYHLRPGGVTSVLLRAGTALVRQGVRLVALVGEPAAGSFPFPVVVVPGLGYGGEGERGLLADALRTAATGALDGPPEVWHIHNHALGKNGALPAAVAELAGRGAPLLLQLHDFAEDGRPDNYRLLRAAAGADGVARFYPTGPHVHYALLNQRDRNYLIHAACPPDHAHLLPNPIVLPVSEESPPRGIVLYPTRAIRRKNLGEFLLWSLLDEAGRRWQTTLAPTSPVDCAIYRRWQAVAGELRLPVDFAVGESPPRSMSDLLAGAEAVLTTSVAEGFGLSFLEPWLAGRPVFGRDLPGITADFKSKGVDLSMLYPRLAVPVEWVGREVVRTTVEAGLRAVRTAYGRDTEKPEVEAALASALDDGGLDFGRLDEVLQEQVLRYLATHTDARAHLRPASALRDVSPKLLARNRRVVSECYGEEAYVHGLLDLYRVAISGTPGEHPSVLNAAALLDQFLNPAHFNLLRT
jgi:glycosyltransferase involved in cell wall biosynthesis